MNDIERTYEVLEEIMKDDRSVTEGDLQEMECIELSYSGKLFPVDFLGDYILSTLQKQRQEIIEQIKSIGNLDEDKKWEKKHYYAQKKGDHANPSRCLNCMCQNFIEEEGYVGTTSGWVCKDCGMVICGSDFYQGRNSMKNEIIETINQSPQTKQTFQKESGDKLSSNLKRSGGTTEVKTEDSQRDERARTRNGDRTSNEVTRDALKSKSNKRDGNSADNIKSKQKENKNV